MKRYLMAIIVLRTSSYINAGTAPVQEPVDREMIAKIRDEGLNRSQAPETFTHFTEVIGPRLTATPAYKNAADFNVGKRSESASLVGSTHGLIAEARSRLSRSSNSPFAIARIRL
jgi:hypothetical protein